ncbi:AfsR/SARP family transcriptional regulator [Subtercola lobariae]|uniref:SARP family transcriptional regulator n=1 Tax=Subtercola lobariae TaxID=1588641 RepID=A0A917B710_9MICO|nr:BTAD domain-containing putative transcriptional regulator [Subtercola lobariae]GGF28362.1 SARP family transcriptional regulator [Subtercola lobariae]
MKSKAVPLVPDPVCVAVLGPVAVRSRAGGMIEPPGVLAKRFLALLALAGGRSVSTATIVDELWQDDPPAGARSALQTLVSRLRSVCSDGLIETTAAGYRLTCAPEQIDLGLAQQRLAQSSGSLEALRDTLALWRGEPGGDLGESDVTDDLREQADSAHELLSRLFAETLFNAGEYDEALGVARRLRLEHPLDDTVTGLTLRVLSAAGRRADALAEFEAYRRRLRDELGTSPGPELVSLHTALLRETSELEPSPGSARVDASLPRLGEPAASAPSPAVTPRRSPLRLGVKAPPNELIGRDPDIAALNQLITRARLVTVLGAGGLGKTRLAQALSNDEARGDTAVIFVELASVRSPDDLVLAIGQASGIREAQAANRLHDLAGRLDLNSRILTRLRDQPTLLVLDNCEHIVDAVAAWAADALEQVPSLRVLTTSRAPLQVSAELVYPLGALSALSALGAPPQEALPSQPSLGPAVQLFFERAQAARPSVTLNPETVARLCNRLDGMPLAIELAAARVRTMTVDEIERRLTNRFALLTGGDRTAPARHQTLWAVIDWSWNLLTERQRQVLRRLSLFSDGFTEQAAELVAVSTEADVEAGTAAGSAADPTAGSTGTGGAADITADIAADLEALVNQSLLTVAESESTGQMRYRMLETVREFGQMTLIDSGEDAAAMASMAAWASSLSIELMPRLDGRGQVEAFRLVQDEQDNLVDILRRALAEHDGRTSNFVFAILCSYWTMRGAHWEVIGFGPAFFDATAGYDPLSEGPDDRSQLRATAALARCLAIVAVVGLMGELRTMATARSRLKKLTRLDDIADERIRSAAHLVIEAGRFEDLFALQARAMESPDPMTAAFGFVTSSQEAENDGDIERAVHLAQRGYDLAVTTEDEWTKSMIASTLAQLHTQLGHPRAALSWAMKARAGLALLNAEDDLQQLDWVTAMNQLSIGELNEAEPAFHVLADRAGSPGTSVVHDVMTHDLSSIGWLGLAEIARKRGESEAAITGFHRAFIEYGTMGERMAPWYLMVSAAYLAARSLDGWGDEAEDAFAFRVARRARARTLANARMARPSPFADKPVLGCVLVGLAAFLLDPGPHHDEQTALALLALGERLNSREDSPAMGREQHFARASTLAGATAVAEARARVAHATPNESAALAVSVLKECRAFRW